jgi:hypothetical protein
MSADKSLNRIKKLPNSTYYDSRDSKHKYLLIIFVGAPVFSALILGFNAIGGQAWHFAILDHWGQAWHFEIIMVLIFFIWWSISWFIRQAFFVFVACLLRLEISRLSNLPNSVSERFGISVTKRAMTPRTFEANQCFPGAIKSSNDKLYTSQTDSMTVFKSILGNAILSAKYQA